MNEDREKGRIKSLRVKREKAAEFARSMIPVFALARQELRSGRHDGITLRRYADWLNGRNYKTARGKVWRAETVSRVFDVHHSLRQQANQEHDRAVAVVEFKHLLLSPRDRRDRRAEHQEALHQLAGDRDRQIADAEGLGRALVGR